MTASRGGGVTGVSHEYASKAVISESREQVAWELILRKRRECNQGTRARKYYRLLPPRGPH